MGRPMSPIVANLFMEDFEERALESATRKSACFFRYVDNTFVVWPHGSENLHGFLEHLNSIHPKIQFNMEVEKNFLDVLVRRKVDGTLGHSVYRQPTHSDLYLRADSCHQPAQRTLVHKPHVISDPENLSTELSHHAMTFRQNSYSERQIKRALRHQLSVQRLSDGSN